jgi:putative flavoprotein involved in K+ transport
MSGRLTVTEHIDVVVIGAGQAGLSVGYYLSQMGRRFVILEKASTIVPAWRSRWDSFTLVLPNWTVRLPDFAYDGDDPDGFMGRDALVEYLEAFSATFEPEVRFGQTVSSVERNPDGDNFLVRTQDGIIEANNVVVAVGTFQAGRIPAFGANIASSITQLHSSHYVKPSSLADGAVMVVGSGQSGSQIAEELYQSGRKVFLCVGGATRIPRRYRGKDSVSWLVESGFFDQKAESLPSSKARFKAHPFLTGKDGGHSLDLHQFARDGVVLLGHMDGADGTRLTLRPDLYDNLKNVDQFVVDWKHGIDELIKKRGLPAPEEPAKPALTDGYDSELIETLDLAEEGISTIIWATGYKFDYSWIKLPLLDEDGYPTQVQGVTNYAGLFFVGLHFMHRRKSGLLLGVAEDVAHVAEAIAAG